MKLTTNGLTLTHSEEDGFWILFDGGEGKKKAGIELNSLFPPGRIGYDAVRQWAESQTEAVEPDWEKAAEAVRSVWAKGRLFEEPNETFWTRILKAAAPHIYPVPALLEAQKRELLDAFIADVEERCKRQDVFIHNLLLQSKTTLLATKPRYSIALGFNSGQWSICEYGKPTGIIWPSEKGAQDYCDYLNAQEVKR